MAQAPRPDAKALDAAWRPKRSGSSASVVVREMLSDYRQTGPQTVVILTTTGYREAEIGLALASEARADAGTMASPTAGCDPGDIGKAINDVSTGAIPLASRRAWRRRPRARPYRLDRRRLHRLNTHGPRHSREAARNL